MYNDGSIINLSFNIEKIKKIKDDIIENYFFISNFLNDKKQKSFNKKAIDKIILIQSKLDFAMNFSVSKIDSLILTLNNKLNYDSSINKKSINHEFFSSGTLNPNDNSFINNKFSKKDAKFFENLDFSDFDEKEDVLDKSDIKIPNDMNQVLNNSAQVAISPEEILFFDEKINTIEMKIQSDIDQIKTDNKFISDMNDHLMIQINNLSSKPGSTVSNTAYESNAFYLSLEKNLKDITSKMEGMNYNISKLNHLSDKLENFLESSTVEVKENIENYDLQDKVSNLKKENDLYKRKFQNSLSELEVLRSQSHEENFYFQNNEKYLANTSKKLENLENIISHQINDFKDIEDQRNELVKLFENKISYLKNKLNEREIQTDTYLVKSDSIAAPNSDYYSLLVNIENKLNNLNNDFVSKEDLKNFKDNFDNGRESDADRIINYLNEKNNETFSQIKDGFKESYEKINKSVADKNNYLQDDYSSQNLVKTDLIKSKNNENNNIIKEQSLDENIFENNLILDLEKNVNKLREFERFLIDLTFEIDEFKQ